MKASLQYAAAVARIRNSGTSEGARKGWEARRRGIAEKQTGGSFEWAAKLGEKSGGDTFHDLHVDGIRDGIRDAYKDGSGGVEPSAKEIEGIAKMHLMVDDLKAQGRDRHDFHPITAGNFAAALDAARKSGSRKNRGAVANSGTSEGAHKGWETRRAGYEKQVKRLGIIDHGDDESTRVMPSDVADGKFDVWHHKGGVRTRVSDPSNPVPIGEAQQKAVSHAMSADEGSATANPESKAADEAEEKPARGLSLDEARSHLKEREKHGVFGVSWSKLEKMQGGKLRNSGTSEGAHKGWETRRGASAGPIADAVDRQITKEAAREYPLMAERGGAEHAGHWRDELVAQLDRQPMQKPLAGFEAFAARQVAKELTYPEHVFRDSDHPYAGIISDAKSVRDEAIRAIASGDTKRMAKAVDSFNRLIRDRKQQEKDSQHEADMFDFNQSPEGLALRRADREYDMAKDERAANSKPCGDSHIPDGHQCHAGEGAAKAPAEELPKYSEETKSEAKLIAKTALQQIMATDRMALFAWGARDMLAIMPRKEGEEYVRGGVTMTVSGAKLGRGKLSIKLMGDDTYTVEAFKVRGTNVTSKGKASDIYAENLMETIDRMIERDHSGRVRNCAEDGGGDCGKCNGTCDKCKRKAEAAESAEEVENRKKKSKPEAEIPAKAEGEKKDDSGTHQPLHTLNPEELRNATESTGIFCQLPCEVLANRSAPAFKMPIDGWLHLAPTGLHPHSKGFVQVIDDEAVDAIVSSFNATKEDPKFSGVLVDYDHDSLGGPTEAAGWIDELSKRDDGLWGRVRWSDKGEEAIAGGRYRFVSPVWKIADCERLEGDANLVRPRRMDSLALTNDPNMAGLYPITK